MFKISCFFRVWESRVNRSQRHKVERGSQHQQKLNHSGKSHFSSGGVGRKQWYFIFYIMRPFFSWFKIQFRFSISSLTACKWRYNLCTKWNKCQPWQFFSFTSCTTWHSIEPVCKFKPLWGKSQVFCIKFISKEHKNTVSKYLIPTNAGSQQRWTSSHSHPPSVFILLLRSTGERIYHNQIDNLMLWWPNWCPDWFRWPNRWPNVSGDQIGGQNWN